MLYNCAGRCMRLKAKHAWANLLPQVKGTPNEELIVGNLSLTTETVGQAKHSLSEINPPATKTMLIQQHSMHCKPWPGKAIAAQKQVTYHPTVQLTSFKNISLLIISDIHPRFLRHIHPYTHIPATHSHVFLDSSSSRRSISKISQILVTPGRGTQIFQHEPNPMRNNAKPQVTLSSVVDA